MITSRALKQVLWEWGGCRGGCSTGPQNTLNGTGKSSSDPVPFTHDFQTFCLNLEGDLTVTPAPTQGKV